MNSGVSRVNLTDKVHEASFTGFLAHHLGGQRWVQISGIGGTYFVMSTTERSKVCEWYLKNRCTRGEKCRFLHDKPSEEIKVGVGKRLGKWKREGLQSRARKRDWEKYNVGDKVATPGVDKIDPLCKCNLTCVRRKVTKKTAKTFGKIFFNCPNWQRKDKNCHFFRWLSDQESSAVTPTPLDNPPKKLKVLESSSESSNSDSDD